MITVHWISLALAKEKKPHAKNQKDNPHKKQNLWTKNQHENTKQNTPKRPN